MFNKRAPRNLGVTVVKLPIGKLPRSISPSLKKFIDTFIVPALVKSYLEQKDVAEAA